MSYNTLNDYRYETLKVNQKREHKIKNSITTQEIYKQIKKQKLSKINSKDFYAIIREVNKQICKELIKGKEIEFPNKMGSLELRKAPKRIQFENGKLKTNLPIDWKKTLELWYEDEQAKEKKVLVRFDIDYVFKLIYNSNKASFNNKTFFQFRPHRQLKQLIAKECQSDNIDALLRNRFKL